MRVFVMFLAVIVCGLAGFGGVLIYGDQIASFFGLTKTEDKAPVRQASRRRSAPYVTLVPAETLPEKSSAAPGSNKPRMVSATPPRDVPAPVAPPVAKAPKAPPPPPVPPAPASEPSLIARQALEEITGTKAGSPPRGKPEKPAPAATVTRPAEVKPPPPVAPVTPPAPVAAKVPAPAPKRITAPAPAPKIVPTSPPAPAAPVRQETTPGKKTIDQEASADAKKLQLKYESETVKQEKVRDAPASLMSDKPVRFRRLLPHGTGQLKARDRTIALAGVEGLGQDRQCTYPSGKTWDCGKWGSFALRRLIRGRSVVCELIEQISETTVTGRCDVAGVDINEWVVRRGWAKPAQATAASYADALEAARKDQIGQWSVEPPASP